MSKIRFVGDIHGNNNEYLSIIHGVEKSIQVGDYGCGFVHNPIPFSDRDNHRFIRGNHDNPHQCKAEANWIPDGTVEDNMMFIGGASSIDRHWRTEGLDWWPEEQCSYAQLDRFISIAHQVQPEIMVTHECPDSVSNVLCEHTGLNKWPDESVTRKAFDVLFHIHKPKLWLFGHWHVDFDVVIDGCRFICLNVYDYADVDTENLNDIRINQ